MKSVVAHEGFEPCRRRSLLQALLIPSAALAVLLTAETGWAACNDGVKASCTVIGDDCPGEKVCDGGIWSECTPTLCHPPPALTPVLRSEGLGTGNELYSSTTGPTSTRSFVHARTFTVIATANAGPAVNMLRLSGNVDVVCELGGTESTFRTPFFQDVVASGTTAGLTLSRTFNTSAAVCPTTAAYRRTAVRYEMAATMYAADGRVVSTWPAKAEYLRLLKFMSWNIHHGVGTDSVLNLQRISNTLLASGAHFAGFQDVDRHWSGRSDCQDQPELLRQQTGMSVLYSPSLDEGANLFQCGLGSHRQYGNALLSRFPITSNSIGFLYHPDGFERRSVQAAVVTIGGTPLTLFSSHLQHGSTENDKLVRYFQALELEDFIGNFGGQPKFLMADLNAEESTWELQPIRDALQDSWFAAGNASRSRIDYVFSSPLPVSRAFFVDTLASDHHAYVSWISLEPTSVP
ncbi:hypothetical protein FOF48_25480 [Corallococcus sp. Z5C101001]|nr:hypothetical protein FOF48_25480 [Corallococcus sp. Z5C101001]